MSRLVRTLSLIALATPLLTPLAAQSTLVVPNGYANTVGNSNNAFPWSRGTSSMRIQQIYDTSHFTAQGVNGPILIQNLRFRPYPGATTTWAGGSWPNVRIDMASCPSDYSTASSTFANNLGPDAMNVLQGPVVVSGGSTLGAGVVVPWHISIPLTSSFVYDPTLGKDLTIDVWLDGTGWTGTSRAVDVVSTAGVARAARVYNTTGLTATTGTVGTEHAMICEFTYVPAVGLFPGFGANVRGGASPLTVQFTSQSYSSDPGGITSYAWDFDGDGIVDSFAQNPIWTYTSCGNYTVALTITDASHPAATLTRSNWIQTDRISADFTSVAFGPNLVQFTDTSSMPASSWAWDFNGDSVIDSTLQNPVWNFPNANPTNVSLTVTRLCAPASTITKQVSPIPSLSIGIPPSTTGAALNTLYANVQVLNPLGVTLSGMDVYSGSVNTALSVDVYLKPGSYSTFEYTPSAWTQIGSATGTTAASTTTASRLAFASGVHIPQGTYGLAMRYVGASPRYNTLTALTTVANADLSVTMGALTATTTGPFAGTSTTVTSLRQWVGTIYYHTHNVDGTAGYGFFGPGCAGALGVSRLTATRPVLGSTLISTLSNLPQSAAILVTGFSNTTSSSGALPFDLSLFGAPGCFARVSPDVTSLVLGPGSSASLSLPIPNFASYSGIRMFQQGFVLDATANALGASLSDAAGMVVGY